MLGFAHKGTYNGSNERRLCRQGKAVFEGRIEKGWRRLQRTSRAADSNGVARIGRVNHGEDQPGGVSSMVSNRSNGIYRSIIFAVAGLILIGAGGKPAPRADTKQAQAAQPVASKADNADPIIPKTDKTESKDQGCKQGQDDRQSDLCAQWKAADAATDAARSSDTQTFIGWIGLLLGGITMGAAIAAALYARRAAVATESTVAIAQEAAKGADSALNIANRNADAAVRLADQTEQNGKRQLRAYLSIKSFTLEDTEWDDDKFVLNMEITNNGVTPAYMDKIVCVVRWAYEGGDTKILDIDTRINTKSHKDISIQIPMPFHGSFEECEKDGHVLIFGRIDYKDVFEDAHTDSFSFRTNADDFGRFYDLDLPYQFSAFPVKTILDAIENEEAENESKGKGEDV